jgi:hypothetical protein
MHLREALTLVSFCSMIAACAARDRSITYGADGKKDWQRRLDVAVQPGISEDSARAIMTANGFSCSAGVDSVSYVACSKDRRAQPVFRRWRAVFVLDSQRRVTAVRASTGMVGP